MRHPPRTRSHPPHPRRLHLRARAGRRSWLVVGLCWGMLVLPTASCTHHLFPKSQYTPADVAIITQEEIAASDEFAKFRDLHDVVESLRPAWLHRQVTFKRGSSADSDVIVFLDEQRMGGADALRRFSVTAAERLRYFSPSEAQARFGAGYLNGVIQITTPKG